MTVTGDYQCSVSLPRSAVDLLSPPVKYFTDRSKAVLLLWILFCYLCFVSVMLSCLFIQHCGHLLGRANLLAILYVMFSRVFVTFPFGVLGQVWNSIVSIPDLWHLPYFVSGM